MTDVWTTGAVLVGFALMPITGWLRLDPLVAALVAANILWARYGLLRESIGGLMDKVADPGAVAALKRIISNNAAGAIEAPWLADADRRQCHLRGISSSGAGPHGGRGMPKRFATVSNKQSVTRSGTR